MNPRGLSPTDLAGLPPTRLGYPGFKAKRNPSWLIIFMASETNVTVEGEEVSRSRQAWSAAGEESRLIGPYGHVISAE